MPALFEEFWADRDRYPDAMAALTAAARASRVYENLVFLTHFDQLGAQVALGRGISVPEARTFYRFTQEWVNIAASTADSTAAFLDQLGECDRLDTAQARQYLACFEETRRSVMMAFGPGSYAPFRNRLPG